ncbi:MAG: NUDIX domain-containing protein [Patescibacteria group bacterium]
MKLSGAKPRQPEQRLRRRKPKNHQDEAAVHSTTAGGIIYRRRGKNIEIFFIKDPFNRWTFPKGKHQDGENLIQTALREIKEETGLTGLVYIAPLGRTSFRFRREVGVIHKVVYYFLFEAPPDAKEKLATPEEARTEDKEPIFEAKWVPMDAAFTVSGYKNSDHLLARAFRVIGTRLKKTN